MADEDEVNGLGMVEVDPKLFITCRLCLQEMGHFQIVPTLRRQIKFCFDITVEPFDGLPQLLCRDCKALLTEYNAKKSNFIDKQESLLRKLKICKNEEPDDKSTLSSELNGIQSTNQETADTDSNTPAFSLLKLDKKKKNRLSSTSSAGSVQSSKKSFKTYESNKRKRKFKSYTWRKNYTKRFNCNLCTKSFVRKYRIVEHINSHSKLKSQYDDVFKRKCTVGLTKIDDKPNSTGKINTVMLNKYKILDGLENFYYVSYIQDSVKSDIDHKKPCSDSSDDELFAVKKKRRIHRLSSRSSNETVVIEGNENKKNEIIDIKLEQNTEQTETGDSKINMRDTECINIDDSSDSSIVDIASYINTKLPKDAKVEVKTIENIISVCTNKYLKKIEISQNDNIKSQSNNIDFQLNHKVLSIGRKILNKDAVVNCIGLLRYMEHKNLDIVWIPKSALWQKEFIRIMPKSKSNSDVLKESTAEEFGWIYLPATLEDNMTFEFDANIASTTVATGVTEDNANEETASASKSNEPQPLSVPEQASAFRTSSPLIIRNHAYADIHVPDAEINSKKLLNQSPVANPKQLPKKNSMHEIKTHNLGKESVLVSIDDGQNYEHSMIMPVITSTTSLAKESVEDKNDVSSDSSSVKAPERSAPRIKVKPVSELMEPVNESNAIDNLHRNTWALHAENRIAHHQNHIQLYIPSSASPMQQNVQTLKIAPNPNIMTVQKVSSEPQKRNDLLILDTVEMPNAKTNSPFTYFKKLLCYHKLVFYETLSPVSQYTCLLKFKVQFKQENKSTPVTLCLSLYCWNNYFRICIKDCNQISIDILTISANWQWEIIKIFQGDVSAKILQNAQKLGPEVYNNTKTFLYLLKSIKCKLE